MSHQNSAAPAAASQPSDPAATPHIPAAAASDAAVPAGHAGDANGRRPSNAVASAHEEKGLSTLEREQQVRMQCGCVDKARHLSIVHLQFCVTAVSHC